MKIDPTSFQCPTHQIDLTTLVVDAIESQVPVSSFGVTMADPKKPQTPVATFRVLVQCPAKVPDQPHKLRFSGTIEEASE